MLAYNCRKYPRKLDPVREILAKLDAKQTKTGLSLYNQDQHSSPRLTPLNKTGNFPNQQEDISRKEFFPNVKAARKKAQNRITAGELADQDNYSTRKQNRTKKIPHRLPETTNHTSHHSIDRHDDRINQSYTIPESQFDRDRIDININPFGYNRKTLAFDKRNINYVVEWPETWPFKIMSFQGKAKRKPKRIHRPSDQFLPPCTHDVTQDVTHDNQMLLWKEPTTQTARVLAPVDHPTKPPVFPSRPYVESAVKRGLRKHRSKKENLRQIVLKSQERDLGSYSGDPWTRDYADYLDHDMGLDLDDHDDREEDGSNQKLRQEGKSERVDSVPPSTPVPAVQSKEEDIKEPEHEVQEAHEVLDDIVNQIINENKTPI